MEYFNQALLFMSAHENLAGWAQAAGATIALAFAIGVPAYQRHTQTLDMRRAHANLNLALATSGRFLVNDVLIFLNGIATLASLPRSVCRSDLEVSHLLERINALENREVSHARIITLYGARGALVLANKVLCKPDIQASPLSMGEITNLQDGIARVKERYAIAEYDADFSIGKARSAHIFWPARPIAGVILRCRSFFKHRHVPLNDRLFTTK
jgi:hypothetical protein